MIELYLSKNMIEGSAAYGKYYPRVSYKQTLRHLVDVQRLLVAHARVVLAVCGSALNHVF